MEDKLFKFREDHPIMQQFKIQDPVIYADKDLANSYKMEWRADFNRINESIEQAAIGEMINIAKEMGITDLYFIDEDQVKTIFKRAVPMRRIKNELLGEGYARCPACRNLIHIHDKFCRYCGQAIETEEVL
jgi:rRNA maturation endonuclease Nob1